MVQVPHYSDVTNHFRESSHVQQESSVSLAIDRFVLGFPGSPFVKSSLWHVLFLDRPFSNFDGGDYGFREWLRVFLLHHCFYIRTIDV